VPVPATAPQTPKQHTNANTAPTSDHIAIIKPHTKSYNGDGHKWFERLIPNTHTEPVINIPNAAQPEHDDHVWNAGDGCSMLRANERMLPVNIWT
jgi:hypothetical protein